jgi:hypothetical protein
MTSLPAITGRDPFDALVIRTDYTSEQAWQAVTAALTEESEVEDPTFHIVDDPAWAGASVGDLLAAVPDDVPVLFIADGVAMSAADHPLLAVTTKTRNDVEDEADYEAPIEFGREFRTVPSEVAVIHANLEITNMDFEEFAAAAHRDPEGVFQGF